MPQPKKGEKNGRINPVKDWVIEPRMAEEAKKAPGNLDPQHRQKNPKGALSSQQAPVKRDDSGKRLSEAF
jgi:hypothetical protein